MIAVLRRQPPRSAALFVFIAHRTSVLASPEPSLLILAKDLASSEMLHETHCLCTLNGCPYRTQTMIEPSRFFPFNIVCLIDP